MTGERKTSWKFLAWGVAMLWINTCVADSEPVRSVPVSGTNNPLSTSRTDWKLPDFVSKWKLPETVQIHGFASQSYLHTTENQFFGHTTDTGSLDFTEMGINGSWRPLSNLQTSMQVVYRRAGRTDDSDLRIDFGFLDYSFLSEADNLAGVRLGRVVNPFGLYNDTRDMPFTRPSILLPQSIYFDITRNFALSGDGIQIYGEQRSQFGDFQLQVNGFYSRANDPSWRDAIFGPALGPGKADGELSWIGRLMYEWGGGKVRLGVTSGEVNLDYNPHAPTLNTASLSFQPILFSAQYNAENWSLTGEYAIRTSDFRNYVIPEMSLTGESYYVQGTYRFTSEWEGFLRYDVLYADRDDRNGKKFAAATGGNAYDQFAKDLTVGLRWDVTPSIMLRGEYHYIEGTGWTSPAENQSGTSKYWDLFALSVSFRF
jgi:hypothetical protein